MAKHKISIDEKKCIGCGACASICKNFEIINGKSRAKKSVIDEKDLECNRNAANVCPVFAIKIN